MKENLSLTSSAFENGGIIPAKYTCDGDRKLSPPLSIGGVPEGTRSFVLIMDDPDIPDVKKKEFWTDSFDHWVLFNIPPEKHEILEGTLLGESGLTTRSEMGYTGPCPPPEYEPREHRYFFRLYALSENLHFDKAPTKQQVLSALESVLLGETVLMGKYSR
jgi:Raf kinase inhibitor-like YbhB/YbcL family protein